MQQVITWRNTLLGLVTFGAYNVLKKVGNSQEPRAHVTRSVQKNYKKFEKSILEPTSTAFASGQVFAPLIDGNENWFNDISKGAQGYLLLVISQMFWTLLFSGVLSLFDNSIVIESYFLAGFLTVNFIVALAYSLRFYAYFVAPTIAADIFDNATISQSVKIRKGLGTGFTLFTVFYVPLAILVALLNLTLTSLWIIFMLYVGAIAIVIFAPYYMKQILFAFAIAMLVFISSITFINRSSIIDNFVSSGVTRIVKSENPAQTYHSVVKNITTEAELAEMQAILDNEATALLKNGRINIVEELVFRSAKATFDEENNKSKVSKGREVENNRLDCTAEFLANLKREQKQVAIYWCPGGTPDKLLENFVSFIKLEEGEDADGVGLNTRLAYLAAFERFAADKPADKLGFQELWNLAENNLNTDTELTRTPTKRIVFIEGKVKVTDTTQASGFVVLDYKTPRILDLVLDKNDNIFYIEIELDLNGYVAFVKCEKNNTCYYIQDSIERQITTFTIEKDGIKLEIPQFSSVGRSEKTSHACLGQTVNYCSYLD